MPKITISYRRSDSGIIAGRIYDKLVGHYGDNTIFMDIDSIAFGIDYRDHINEVLSTTDILLAIIGSRWHGTSDTGEPRIFEETDLVRIEVEAALKRRIPVVPILIDDTQIPKPAELPDSLKPLSFRNAAPV